MKRYFKLDLNNLKNVIMNATVLSTILLASSLNVFAGTSISDLDINTASARAISYVESNNQNDNYKSATMSSSYNVYINGEKK